MRLLTNYVATPNIFPRWVETMADRLRWRFGADEDAWFDADGISILAAVQAENGVEIPTTPVSEASCAHPYTVYRLPDSSVIAVGALGWAWLIERRPGVFVSPADRGHHFETVETTAACA